MEEAIENLATLYLEACKMSDEPADADIFLD
jgi:hypothetical protein